MTKIKVFFKAAWEGFWPSAPTFSEFYMSLDRLNYSLSVALVLGQAMSHIIEVQQREIEELKKGKK